MNTAFMGLMIGAAVVLVIVVLAWVASVGRDVREITGSRSLRTRPISGKERPSAGVCPLCGAEDSPKKAGAGCPLIEAYGCVRAETIRLEGGTDGKDPGPEIDELRQG